MKKKRKVNTKRLALLVCCILVALTALTAGSVWAVRSVMDWNHQKQLHEQAEIAAADARERQNLLESVSCPADFDAGVFEQLKTQALSGYDAGTLENIAAKERIEDDEIEQAQTALDGTDWQAQYFLENIAAYPQFEIEFYLKDTDRFEFVKAWPQQENYQTAPAALDESLDTIPHLLQWDLRWGYQPYGDSTVAVAGCAPTCLSMVFSYLKQDPSITPSSIKSYSENNGYYVSGAGTAHSLLSDAGALYGVSSTGIYADSASVQQALEEGDIVILNMLPGQFTATGHFIVAAGMENGQVKILDPNSNSRSRLWNLDEVMAECAYAWAYWVE